MKTQNEVKHTETPWELVDFKDSKNRQIIWKADGSRIPCAVIEAEEANAKFIVTACNNFDNMLLALKEAEFFIRNSIEQTQKHQGALTMVRKAIQNAESHIE